MDKLILNMLLHQKEIDNIKDELFNKYNIDLSETFEIINMIDNKWYEKDKYICIYDEILLDIEKDNIEIYKSNDIILLNINEVMSSEGSYIYDTAKCIILSNANKII